MCTATTHPKSTCIYLALFSVHSAREAYTWSLFVSCAGGTQGHLFRATSSNNLTGSQVADCRVPSFVPLVFESKECDFCNDPDLFLLLELGRLGDRALSIRDIQAILEKVAIPTLDDEYSHLFDGRTWVIKAIMRLSAYGILRSRRLESMEDEIQTIAARAFDEHEQGLGWTVTKLLAP